MTDLTFRTTSRNIQCDIIPNRNPLIQQICSKTFRCRHIFFRRALHQRVQKVIHFVFIVVCDCGCNDCPHISLRKPLADSIQFLLVMISIYDMFCSFECVQPLFNLFSAVSMYISVFERFRIIRLGYIALYAFPQLLSVKLFIHKVHRPDRPVSPFAHFLNSLAHCDQRDDLISFSPLFLRFLHMDMVFVCVYVQDFRTSFLVRLFFRNL